ncbi:MAG: glycosyltransferase family 39 protein [Candidatus Binataceae bacterium]
MALCAACLIFYNLGSYNPSYDSGVYLESARMMGRGFSLYRQIFDSQPPLWLPLIYASFRLFGESVFAGQVVTAIAGLITIVAVMQLTGWVGGTGGAILAGLLVTLSPLELQWSRTLNGDVPSVAFSAVSIALAAGYARNGRRRWLIAAAIAVTCSILTKLSGVYALPVLTIFVLARWKNSQNRSQWQRLWFAAQDALIVGGIVFGVTLLAFIWFGPALVWNQAVAFHWAARSANEVISLHAKFHHLTGLIAGERLLVITAPLALLCLVSGVDGLALLAWPIFTFAGLVMHYPLYDHHLVALIPALAAAIGAGAGQLATVYRVAARWLSAQSRPFRIVALTACAGVGMAIFGIGITQAWREAAAQLALIQSAGLSSQDLGAVELIVFHSQQNDMIITDDQGLAFLADRDVPPGLADTSYTRIGSGYLQPSEVIEQAERHHARLLLLWSGRLASMPEVVQWADRYFPHRINLAAGRVVYLAK